MRYFILTNNPMAVDRFASSHEVCFVQGTLMDVLVHARDQIHNGAEAMDAFPRMGDGSMGEEVVQRMALKLNSTMHLCPDI